jgi:hypothetical protein
MSCRASPLRVEKPLLADIQLPVSGRSDSGRRVFMQDVHVARAFGAFAGLFLCGAAAASGGHWLVDDAAVFPAGTLGIEVWYEDFGDDGNAFTLQPAYTLRNGLELTLVLESTDFDGRRDELFGIEAKGLWYDLENGDEFGLGWVAGTRNDSSGSLQETVVYVPLTLPLTGDWLVHFNLGWLRQHDGDTRDSAFYGVGSQLALRQGVELIAEVLDSDRDDTFAQAGLRFALAQGQGLLDLSYGRNLDAGDDNWITIGFAWEF